jgi:hypothetical protein
MTTDGLKSAADTTKQIITLSTGIITLTVTFLEKILQPTATAQRAVPWPMFTAWIFFGVAIVAAMVTLGAITGTLDAVDRQEAGLDLNQQQQNAVANLSNGPNVKYPALVMSVCFGIAMALTIATGFLLS